MSRKGFIMLALAATGCTLAAGCLRSATVPPPASMSRRPAYPPPSITRIPQTTPRYNAPTQPPVLGSNPWKPDVPARDWRHIVIHHTATDSGSVESINAAHLQRKDKSGNPWLGIGYHFVIGNGNGMGDGEIEPTFRWKEQMHGAHAGDTEYNQHGIGVVLVGNFENTSPSPAQLAAVKQLVATLKSEYGIPASEVIGHSEVKSTACPGKHFPIAEVSQSSVMPYFSQRMDAMPQLTLETWRAHK